jgi:hypothetical protein
MDFRYTQFNYKMKQVDSCDTLTKETLMHLCKLDFDLKLEHYDDRNGVVDSIDSKSKLMECIVIGFKYCIVREVKVDIDFLEYKKGFQKIKDNHFAKQLYNANLKLASNFYGIDKRLLSSESSRLKGLIKKIEQL